MFQKYLIIASKVDAAGINITTQLSQFRENPVLSGMKDTPNFDFYLIDTPIIDDKGVFIGVVTLEEIREIMFKPELYDTTYVKDLMFVPDVIVDYNESMEDVAKKFRIPIDLI